MPQMPQMPMMTDADPLLLNAAQDSALRTVLNDVLAESRFLKPLYRQEIRDLLIGVIEDARREDAAHLLIVTGALALWAKHSMACLHENPFRPDA
ncbi:MAG: hypothetical protein JWP57_4523 [Spirosoma sp.]|nr:hypothetical protein [Spirosoma sp.]